VCFFFAAFSTSLGRREGGTDGTMRSSVQMEGLKEEEED
jgi:hypothetical protein